MARITPETTLRAMAEVTKGQVFDLGSVLSRDMPGGRGDDTFAPFQLLRHRSSHDLGRGMDSAGTTFSTELIQGTPHVGTHLDAFCHCQFEGRVFGGGTSEQDEGDFGWRHAGMETVRPIVTRGIFLDIPADRGVERIPDYDEIEAVEVRHALLRRGIELRPGDAVLIRTGKMRQYDAPEDFTAGQPGLSVDAAIWLYDQGMAVLGADNTSVEPQPVPDWSRNLHVEMLYRRGVHLIEWLDLEPLHEAGAETFLFVCSPLKLRGATGSWVRPLAII
jgi:kynurenine formamidase